MKSENLGEFEVVGDIIGTVFDEKEFGQAAWALFIEQTRIKNEKRCRHCNHKRKFHPPLFEDGSQPCRKCKCSEFEYKPEKSETKKKSDRTK